MSKNNLAQDHSSAWVIQTWLSFVLAVSTTTIGILYLPVDNWIKAFMGMGLTFTIGSTVSLTKTQRDLHEGKKLLSRVDEAKVEKLLNEHHSM
ncbi:MAG: YiaA/YiaB family inner membrane protein [Crocosphaera sp.]